MGRTKKRGIAVPGTWVPVERLFLKSRACAELSPHEAKLLLDLLAMLGPNARGNGDLSITPKTMRVRGWTSRSTLNKAIAGLEACGLLFQTRQGSKLKCSLYAVTLYPLDCDLEKLDVVPGCYLVRDWQQGGAAEPTEREPARWRRTRKTVSVTPPRDSKGENCPATGQGRPKSRQKNATSSRHGTETPVFDPSAVPPRVTYLEKPYPPADLQRPQHRPQAKGIGAGSEFADFAQHARTTFGGTHD